MRLFLYLTSLLVLTLSCGRDYTRSFSTFVDLDRHGMYSDEEYTLTPFQDFPMKEGRGNKGSLSVAVRYNENCRIKSLPVSVELSSPELDSVISLSLDIPLFGENDLPVGKGHFGIFETEAFLINDVKPDPDLSVAVKAKQPDQTRGIISIGTVWTKLSD